MVGSHPLAPRSRGSVRPRSRGSSTSSSAAAPRRLDSRTFLRGLAARAQEARPPGTPRFHSVTHSYMAQLWSGNRQLHYEAWIRDRLGVIEVGLHFEADALTNARLLAAFRARERAIRRALGADVRIEPWDKGWARVWEPVELGAHDRDFLERVGRRIAAYVSALEPMLQAEVPSDVAWTDSRRRR